MIDYANEKNKDECIEVLVGTMWVPIIATDLRILNKDGDFIRVVAVRVRDLTD